MTIRRNAEQEQRIEEALRSGAYRSRDEWLTANRRGVDAKIRNGIEELERGEGIPEEELDAHLGRLKSRRE